MKHAETSCHLICMYDDGCICMGVVMMSDDDEGDDEGDDGGGDDE